MCYYSIVATKCGVERSDRLNTDMRKVISERLVFLRGNRPQKQVAQDCGISDSALSSYENGERIPRDEVKIRLANYYGVTVQSLFFSS